jgi:molybdopterin/thiamine biosynthesis adenylyltransferase
MNIKVQEKQLAGLWFPKRVVIIGCGGIGSNLWDLIAHQTYYAAKLSKQGNLRPYVDNFLLVDADSVELKNLFRQSFFSKHIGMGKAEALVDKYSNQLSDFDITINSKREWLSESSLFLCERDLILLGVDNNASRKVLNDMISPIRENKFKNIIAVNGGNSDTLATVQLMVKTMGDIKTATFEHMHPEITAPQDYHPRDVECTSAAGMAEDPQLFRANVRAAEIMFNIFQNCIECRFADFSCIWADVGSLNFRKEGIPETEVIQDG